ncbi:hypothetical protein G6F68_021354 [Rhizopus microsporus]|nr:hypothetical protein G6F68_021354 [Rhizopus microsporus]
MLQAPDAHVAQHAVFPEQRNVIVRALLARHPRHPVHAVRRPQRLPVVVAQCVQQPRFAIEELGDAVVGIRRHVGRRQVRGTDVEIQV